MNPPEDWRPACAELETKLLSLSEPVRGERRHRRRLHDALRRGAAMLERRRPRLRRLLLAAALVLILAVVALVSWSLAPAPEGPADAARADAGHISSPGS